MQTLNWATQLPPALVHYNKTNKRQPESTNTQMKRASHNFNLQLSGATVHSLRRILTVSLKGELMMPTDLFLRLWFLEESSTACTLVCMLKVYTANQVSLGRAELAVSPTLHLHICPTFCCCLQLAAHFRLHVSWGTKPIKCKQCKQAARWGSAVVKYQKVLDFC